MLIATFVYEDWKQYLTAMQALPTNDSTGLLGGIYDALRRFAKENEKLFSDAEAAKLVSVGPSDRHRQLRDQIAAILLSICGAVSSPFTAAFVAEALVCRSMEKADFETVYPLLERIIKP